MITTRELAELAGVSQSTVSRSLNDSHQISAETKERIRNLAKEYGYKKLKPGHAPYVNKAIAVATTEYDETDDYLLSLYNVLFTEVKNRNYFPVIITCSEDELLDRIKGLTSTGIVEGYIIIKRLFNTDIEEYLNYLKIPHVYVQYFNDLLLETIDLIDTNQFMCGYLAGKHLLEFEHRKFITLTSEGHEFDDRTSGFFQALSEYDLNEKDVLIHKVDRKLEYGYDFVRSNLDLFDKYTAIFAQCDPMAIGCLNALNDCKIKVPKEVSVIGIDGIRWGTYCRPTLTSVSQEYEVVASEAVDHLVDKIKNRREQTLRILVPPKLIVRNSTGPAHAK